MGTRRLQCMLHSNVCKHRAPQAPPTRHAARPALGHVASPRQPVRTSLLPPASHQPSSVVTTTTTSPALHPRRPPAVCRSATSLVCTQCVRSHVALDAVARPGSSLTSPWLPHAAAPAHGMSSAAPHPRACYTCILTEPPTVYETLDTGRLAPARLVCRHQGATCASSYASPVIGPRIPRRPRPLDQPGPVLNCLPE
jgi:hypothetical protein